MSKSSPSFTVLPKLLSQLTQQYPLKTGSLITTLFGDIVVPRGGSISSACLQEVMTALHIDNGAVRTALSRLTDKGHLQRTRSGRNSYYTLASEQHEIYQAAEEIIYAAPKQDKKSPNQHKQANYKLVIKQIKRVDAEHDSATPAIFIDNNTALYFVDSDTVTSPEDLNIQGSSGPLPDWIIEKLLASANSQKYTALNNIFKPLSNAKINGELEATAIRCLLIHEWRRVKLRTPCVPYQLLPQDNLLRATHANVAAWYQSQLPKSNQWLDAKSQSSDEPLGTDASEYQTRFRSS